VKTYKELLNEMQPTWQVYYADGSSQLVRARLMTIAKQRADKLTLEKNPKHNLKLDHKQGFKGVEYVGYMRPR